MESTTYDIELSGIRKTFTLRAGEGGGADVRHAVEEVSLQIRRGEFFSLLGPSGCGKSTLLRLIVGFESPDAGVVRLAGADMAGIPPHRRDVNMVFQNYALFPHLDVAANVAFGLKIQKAKEIGVKVGRALEMVRLSGYEKRQPTTLSGGEQQRVALARAIVTSPRVLLLDEPLSALDLKLRQGLRDELRRIQRELGMTFIYVTHDQEEALAMSDRIAVMNRGRVEQVGSPEEIYERPATRFVAEFVGSGNFFEGTGDGIKVRTEDGLTFESAVRGAVTLLVRPERIQLNGGRGVPAEVLEVIYRGSSTALHLRVGERRILVEDANDGGVATVRPGDRTSVSWRAEDVVVLPR